MQDINIDIYKALMAHNIPPEEAIPILEDMISFLKNSEDKKKKERKSNVGKILKANLEEAIKANHNGIIRLENLFDAMNQTHKQDMIDLLKRLNALEKK